MSACPICGGARIIHERSRHRGTTLYVARDCWACTPRPIRAA